MKVPQFIPYIDSDDYNALKESFEIAWITEGPKTKEFHEKLLDLTGAKYGVFAPNGTLAIYLALKAIGVGEGDEVIVPNFTFLGSGSAVEMVGATPVFCDVNNKNFQIDIDDAIRVTTNKTKAIMPVHVYGTAVEMEKIISYSERYNVKIVEDAAQGIGVTYKNKHVGAIGDIGTFSFFADKTITTGEGGFITTNNEEYFQNLLYLRNQGRLDRGSFIHPRIGYNFRITDLQASLGIHQLSKLSYIKKKKTEIYTTYFARLSKIDDITFFMPNQDANYIPFRVSIITSKRKDLSDFMASKGIEVRTFFYPLHKQPCFEYLKKDGLQNFNDKFFKNSIYGYDNGVCLPSFVSISEEQLNYVCSVIEEFFLDK
jgi:perosamine synthetase